jgi:hypothetical protein
MRVLSHPGADEELEAAARGYEKRQPVQALDFPKAIEQSAERQRRDAELPDRSCAREKTTR